MIELFDAGRLLPRRDHSLALVGLVLALTAGGMSVYAQQLQTKLRAADAERQTLTASLRQAQARPAPTRSLLTDLAQQLHRLEADISLAQGTNVGTVAGAGTSESLAASSWLARVHTLGQAELSLSKIDIERHGGARFEGLAHSAQAVSGFVQAFSAQERQSQVQPRSIEVRHDKTSAPYLRFVVRASATPQSAPAAAPRTP